MRSPNEGKAGKYGFSLFFKIAEIIRYHYAFDPNPAGVTVIFQQSSRARASVASVFPLPERTRRLRR
jgi:hypothetical protein